jgi:HEPN domain-containing protein
MTTSNDHLEWIRYAERDLKSAKTLANADEPDAENACYLCQQSAEKALKAFLIYNKIQYRFIHDLDALCKDCEAVDSSFSTIKNQCSVLTDYITTTRYPDDYDYIVHDMIEAIEFAEYVLDFVMSKMGLVILVPKGV